MSTYEKYLGTSNGRTFIVSSVISIVLGYIAFIIPLATNDPNAWYSFLYADVRIDEANRFNEGLIFAEVAVLTLFYLFLVISLGSYAEVNNRLPSWGEIFLSGIITFILALLLPEISVGDVNLGGGSGFKHFTEDMQTWVIFGTLLGMILMTLYMFYTSPVEE